MIREASMPLSDFEKIALGAIGGFLIAVGAEPIKLRFSERHKRKNLRRVLYKKLLLVRDASCMVLKALEKGDECFARGMSGNAYALELFPNIERGIFRHAMGKEGGTFYKLDIAMTVVHVLDGLGKVSSQTTPAEIKDVASKIVNEIDSAVSWRRISGKYLTELAWREDWEDAINLPEGPDPNDPIWWGYKDKSLRRLDGVLTVRPSLAWLVFRVRKFRRGLQRRKSSS
jgi:hypothetical protein